MRLKLKIKDKYFINIMKKKTKGERNISTIKGVKRALNKNK